MASESPQESFGCTQCWPPDAAAAWDARGSLVPYSTLIDDSHLMVMILTCPPCTQQFVSIFLEFVDWADSDDSQYWTVLPLTAAEVRDLAVRDEPSVIATLNRLAPNRRCLKRDWPKGEAIQVSWGTGVHIVT